MYKYLIDEVAQAELVGVGGIYMTYFARLGNAVRGREWADRFYEQYRRKIDELKKNPYRYGLCTLYPFNSIDTEYRSFTVGWFTVFYTVEADSFTVWHIRSSRSDFSNIRTK